MLTRRRLSDHPGPAKHDHDDQPLLAARRHAQAKAAGEWETAAASAADTEIAAALTLAARAASMLTDRAVMLTGLPATLSALATGRIDLPRTQVMVDGLAGQPPALARAIEAALIGRAPAQTTGQLRAALSRALLAAGPQAAEDRRRAEEAQAFVERGPETGGVTASLAGRHLPVTETVAAWNHITTLARQLRTPGSPVSLDQLRVQVFLALLTGHTPARAPADSAPDGTVTDGTASGTTGSTKAQNATAADGSVPSRSGTSQPGTRRSGTHESGTRGMDSPCPSGRAAATVATTDGAALAGTPVTTVTPVTAAVAPADGLTGRVNLTVPLTTLLGLTGIPGELGGFGPITAHTARELATSTVAAPGVRWCLTVTSDTGQPIAHGCAARTRAKTRPPEPQPDSRAAPPANGSGAGNGPARHSRDSSAASGGPGWNLAMTITALADTDCGHSRESLTYRPPPGLQHLIQVRNPCCTAPGCRMPAVRCDQDHTIPYQQGGRTCECNLAPLCRYHHRVKHTQGWGLEQPEPGIYVWTTPAGWTYITGPNMYAA